MLLGHYAIGFAAKRFIPHTHLVVLLYATTFLDVIWAVTFLIGVESAHSDPGNASFLQFSRDYPISHSFVTSILCSLIFAFIYWLGSHSSSISSAIIIGLAVFSHWVFDLFSSLNGLPLYSARLRHPELWNDTSRVIVVIFEILLLGLGLWLYARTTRAVDRIGKYGLWIYIVSLTVAYLALELKFFPISDHTLYGLAVAVSLLPMCATWIDERREADAPEIDWAEKRQAVALWLNSRKSKPQSAGPIALSDIPLLPNPKLTPIVPPESGLRPGYPHYLSREEVTARVCPPRHGADLKLALFLGVVPLVVCLTSYFVTGYVLNKLHAGAEQQQLSTSALDEIGSASEREFARAVEDERITDMVIQRKPKEVRLAIYRYAKESSDIARILREQLEDKMNVGGAIAASVMNLNEMRGKWNFKTIDEIGLRKITEDDALVNLVLNGSLKIDWIWIHPITQSIFKITIKLTNLTEGSVDCTIPEGQVFELKDQVILEKTKGKVQSVYQKVPQAPASKEGGKRTIPRSGSTETITGYCTTPGYFTPEGWGNLAIYRINEEKLQALMERFQLARNF